MDSQPDVDDLIVRKGENIYASQIEQKLSQCHLVAEVVVVGVPHPKDGAVPIVCLVLRDPRIDKQIQGSFIAAYAKVNLTPLEIPIRLIIIQSLGDYKDPTGKVSRSKIKESAFFRNLKVQ